LDARLVARKKTPVSDGCDPSNIVHGDLDYQQVAINEPLLRNANPGTKEEPHHVQVAHPPQWLGPMSLSPGMILSVDGDGFVAKNTESASLANPKQTTHESPLHINCLDDDDYFKPTLDIEAKDPLNTSVFSNSVPYRLMDTFLEEDKQANDPVTQGSMPILSESFDLEGTYSWNAKYRKTSRIIRCNRDLGVGHERLAFALSEIAASQPFNNIRIRSDFQYGWQFPNRAEYLWAGPSKGPRLPESRLDLQEYSVLMETGTDNFSIGTELPLIWLNPTINPNTSGFGDMSVTTKLVVLTGRSLQLTQLTRTHMPTGQASSGRGNGHVAMEPGLITRYTWDDRTMFHGMTTFLFPIGSDPSFSGEILNYSLGIARVWYENDQFAIIPTIESINWSVLSGARGIEQNKISGDYISNLHPGVRFVFDRGGDLGLFEAGFGTGFSLTNNHFYESLFRFDLRWSY
jgi:hypothetical protein